MAMLGGLAAVGRMGVDAVLAQATAAGAAAASAAPDPGRVERVLTTAEELSAAWWRIVRDMGPRLLGALLIVLVAWTIAKWARRSLYRTFDRPQVDQTLLRFGTNAVRWVLLLVALVGALGVLGFPPASVVTVMGAAGLAVGLALQGSLANLAAGIMLLVLRPFRVGDTITVAGVTGKVDEIELFTTKVDTPDNRRVILPNGQVFGNIIDNQTHHAERGVTVPIAVDGGADLDATRAALERAAAGVPGRSTGHAPGVVLDGVGPAGVTWNVTVWAPTASLGTVKQELLRGVKRALDEAGVSAAVPQTVLVHRGWPAGGTAGGGTAGSGTAVPGVVGGPGRG